MQLFGKSKLLRILLLSGLVLLLAGCGAQMRNLPVGAGRVQASASVGGPLVDAFDTTIPIPYAMGGVTYGVSDDLEVYLDAHLVAAAFKFFGATPGIVWFPGLTSGPWVPSLGADVMVFSDFTATRIFPEVVTTLARPIGPHWAPYGGLRHTFQFTQQPVYLPSAFLGSSYRWGRAQVFVEAQWLAANRDNRWNPVDYHGIDNRGAISTQLGLTFDFGGRP